MGRQTQRRLGRIWYYPSLEETIREAVLEEVDTYVLRRQNTYAQYTKMQPILYLCEEAVQWPGTRVSKMRYEQEGLELVGDMGGGGGSDGGGTIIDGSKGGDGVLGN